MAAKNSTNVSGLAEATIEVARANQPLLEDQGVNVAALITKVEGKKSVALQKRSVQEEKFRASREATEISVEADEGLYNDTSSMVDLMAGAVGKTTPLGKQILKVRADWAKQGRARKTVSAKKVMGI